MSLFDKLFLGIVLISIGVNAYIIYYQVESHYKWFLIVPTCLGILFGLYRLVSLFTKKC